MTPNIQLLAGIQATVRLEKDLPMRPGKVERKEFEYIRHDTQSLIASFDVATGQIVQSTCSHTRTEADFALHVRRTIETDPDANQKMAFDYGLPKYPSVRVPGSFSCTN